MSHCVIRNNKFDFIEKVITDSGSESILYKRILDKLPNNIQYNQVSDYIKTQLDTGNIKDLSKEEVALAIWNKYTNQDIDGRDVDINDELDIKYIDINNDINLNSNETIVNVKPGVEEFKNWIDGGNNQIKYQLPQGRELEEYVASEKTIRDLAARISDRIGVPVKFESDRTKNYKGKLENGTAIINLAYATLDTPIHEILGHPIIRAIKNGSKFQIEENLTEKDADKIIEKNQVIEKNGIRYLAAYDAPDGTIIYRYDKTIQTNPKAELYQNLLKELEYGKGKEVLDRIKRDYTVKNISKNYNIIDKTKNTELEIIQNFGNYWYKEYNETFNRSKQFNTNEELLSLIKQEQNKIQKYTLEEQQEEAIVELLGLMTANKLDNVKDGKLISLLKRLLKEMKAFMKQLLGQKEVEIDKLPDNMTINDLADLLAYSNSKLILPGYEVEYTTPDNMKFKTYQEASNHISQLAKSVEDVDLSDITVSKDIPDNFTYIDGNGDKHTFNKINENEYEHIYSTPVQDYNRQILNKERYVNTIKGIGINNFIEKNKEYEQSREIIEEWKRVNNIQYNPEEVYSRGQEFVHIHNAYANNTVETDLWLQNILHIIEDNEIVGTSTELSFVTTPKGELMKGMQTGIRPEAAIYIKAYPKSKDIAFASYIDNFTSSFSRTGDLLKAFSDKKREITGLTFTKSVPLTNINTIIPNLADAIDNVAHHNEIVIGLTNTNFRLHYGEKVPFKTKKIIDSINSILDQKYGKLVKPEIKTKKDLTFEEKRLIELNKAKVKPSFLHDNKWEIEGFDMQYYESKQEAEEALFFFKKNLKERISDKEYFDPTFKSNLPIQPTQTKATLKESVENVKSKFETKDDIYGLKLTYSDGYYFNAFIDRNSKNPTEIWLVNKIDNQPKHKTVEDAREWEKQFLQEFKDKFKKEYTEQALINTKIAALKEVAKKYPRSLIRSEVKSINNYDNYVKVAGSKGLFDPDDLPFQKIPSIKPGIQELFDSNPELANQIYEALGFGTEKVSKFPILNKQLAINTLKERVKELEKELLLTFEGKGKRSEFWINEDIRTWEKIIKTLEDNDNVNVTNVFNNQNVGKDLSDKKGVEVFELETDNVLKVGVLFEKTVDVINAGKKVNSPRIHPFTEFHWYKNEFAAVATKAKGVPLKRGEKLTLTDIEKKNLYSDLAQIENAGLTIDISKHNNFYYNKGEGIHFIDLGAETITANEKNNNFFLDNFFENTSSEEYRKFKKSFKPITQITPQQKQQALQQYSQYLDTIFPDSKVKDIVYHGTNEPIIGEKFVVTEGATGKGIWFSGSKKYAEIQMNRATPSESLIGRPLRGKPTMYSVLLNIKNPKNFYNATGALLVQTPSKFKEQYDKETNDAALFHHPNSKKPADRDSADQVVVFEPEQIHILGTKQDIEGFKEFVGNKNTIFLKPNTDNKTSNTNTNLVNQNILSAQSSENPFKNILENILKTGKVGNMTDLDLFYAKLLLDNLNTFNPKLRIADLGGPLGNINIATQVITLDENLINSGDYEAIVQTVLHEVGHGFLVFPYSAISGELSEEDKLFKLNVQTIFNNFNKKHKESTKPFGDDVKNAFTKPEEFLSEFISSQSFRNYLIELDEKNLFVKMYNAIATRLGWNLIKTKSVKKLENIINTYITEGKTINYMKQKHHLKRGAEIYNKSKDLANIKANILKEIQTLMIDLRDKSYGTSTLKKLNAFEDELLQVNDETAVDLYIQKVSDIFDKTYKKFNSLSKDITTVDEWDSEKFTDLFYTMNMYKSYLKHFNMWNGSYDESITEFLRVNDLPMDPRLSLLASSKKSIDLLYSKIAVKLVSRSLASKELLEELNANITEDNKKITYNQLEESLRFLTDVQDISATSYNAEAAINSKDLITALVANKVKSALNDAIEKDVNVASELRILYAKQFGRVESTVKTYRDLFSNYIQEVEYMEHTGYDDNKNKIYSKTKKKALITEIDYAKYQANKNALYASLEKLPELPESSNEDYQILIKDYREIKARNAIKISLWSKENEELNPDFQNIINKKKANLNPSEFEDWFESNTMTKSSDYNLSASDKDKYIGRDDYGDYIIAKRELVSPRKSKYTNPRWNDVKDDKFYRALLDAYNQANRQLPKSKRLKYGVLPQVPKTYKERLIAGQLPKNNANRKYETYGVDNSELEEQEFFNSGIHIVDSKSFLPIYHTTPMDDDNVTDDILHSVLQFTKMSNKFASFYKINPEISLMKDVVFGTTSIENMPGRMLLKTDRFGKKTNQRLADSVLANKQLSSFLDNSFYNTKLPDIGKQKIAGAVLKYTSINQLGWNLMSALPNTVYANFVVAQEGLFSKHFGGKGDLVKAHIIVSADLAVELARWGGAIENKESKTSYLAKMYQAVQGAHTNEFGEDVSNKMMNNLFSTDSLFVLYSIPEYEIQATTMVAMMLKQQVKTKSGETISLWDAYEQTPEGRIALKAGVIFTKADRDSFIAKLHKINKELHGNYNTFDTPALKRVWWGKFLFQFRNHIFEGFKRRFAKEYVDIESRGIKEGYYRNGAVVVENGLTAAYVGLAKLLRAVGIQIDENRYKYNALKPINKSNSLKVLSDVAAVTILQGVVGMLADIITQTGDDDDEKELLYYTMLTAKKVQSDINFYWLVDYKSLIRQVKNPAVVMTSIENALRGIDLLVGAALENPNDPDQKSYYKIKTGKYEEGDMKATKHIYKAIPVLGQMQRDVQEVAEWYINPTTY